VYLKVEAVNGIGQFVKQFFKFTMDTYNSLFKKVLPQDISINKVFDLIPGSDSRLILAFMVDSNEAGFLVKIPLDGALENFAGDEFVF